jgi:hypothetical protein
MKTVVGDLPATWYEKPAGIVDRVVCVNPNLLGGNGSGMLPGPSCPASYRFTEHYVEGTEPKTNDADFYTSCGIRLVAPFSDWQPYYNSWAAGAVSGAYSYGRFSWSICGFAPKPSAAPSPSGGPSGPPNPFATPPPRGTVPPPQPTPRPTKKP